MARPKEFKRHDVLNQATLTFWRQGYEATSIRTLLEAMGIHRGSLYDTFGDKHSLFKASLEHYDRTVIAHNFAPLQQPDASRGALVDFFKSVVDWSLNDGDRKGCLLVNTAAELASQDPDIAQQVAASFEKIEQTFAAVLWRSRQNGELTHSGEIHLLARYLLVNLQGLRITAKIQPNQPTLQDLADITLSTLFSY
ncbi:MAG: TetR/AcrR family transcriptional regulator [Sodalinema sp.]|jgi:TetR/AcrR family transcriptional repressor of nem operon|uniref:TetR/AcrR family transcriptional regulator n=1 Tax=Sodalinema sp. TaxID=3080550 RepID=UPI0011FFF2A8|nr:MAG: TetR/AcrR family transcriptional regulator [Phormidium sp. SL48-SHIP]